jgi:hypothetical protein
LLVSAAWIFFRANNFNDAVYVITHLHVGLSLPTDYIHAGFISLGIGISCLVLLVIPLIVLALFDYLSLKTDVIVEISKKHWLTRWILYICLLVAIILFMKKGAPAEFVYFQF